MNRTKRDEREIIATDLFKLTTKYKDIDPDYVIYLVFCITGGWIYRASGEVTMQKYINEIKEKVGQ